MPGGKVTIFDDGRCAFCQWAQGVVERADTGHAVEFRDYNLPAHAAQAPFPLSDLAHAMHVQTPDGRWHIGFRGWLAVLKVLPRWRWLGRLMGGVPLRWLGPLVYRVVAANRYRIPGFLLRWMGAPPPCDETCALPSPTATPQKRT